MNTQKTIELLSILVEELGEATKAAGKALRFGIDATNPVTNTPNIESLEREIADVLVAIELLSDVVDMDAIKRDYMPAKREKLAQWRLK